MGAPPPPILAAPGYYAGPGAERLSGAYRILSGKLGSAELARLADGKVTDLVNIRGGKPAWVQDNSSSEAVARSALQGARKLLPTLRDNLGIGDVGALSDGPVTVCGGRIFTEFDQYFRGTYPVYGASVRIKSDDRGVVMDITNSSVPNLAPKAGASVPRDVALKAAIDDYTADAKLRPGTATEVEKHQEQRPLPPSPDKVAMPGRYSLDGQDHLAYRFVLRGPGIGQRMTYYVDEVSGHVVARFPDCAAEGEPPADYTFGGTITIPAQSDIDSPAEWLPCPGLLIQIPLAAAARPTDAQGRYFVKAPAADDQMARATLDSAVATVRPDGVNDEDRASINWPVRKSRLPVDARWPSVTDETNVYYHTNTYASYLGTKYGFSWLSPPGGASRRLWATTQFGGEANAYAYGIEIAFTAAGRPSCVADVIRHECTHNMIYALMGDHFIGSSWPDEPQGCALDEALADYFACAAKGSPDFAPTLGPRFHRNLATPVSMPLPAEPHQAGLIISTALWELRARTEAFGPDERGFDTVVYRAIPNLRNSGQPWDFPAFVRALLKADADTAELNSTVPHAELITAAFSAHGVSTLPRYRQP